MKKTIVYLVRHAETAWNVSGIFQGMRRVPLNRLGKKQAVFLAKKFSKHSFDVIYSSPALRTLQTARCIVPHKKIILDKELCELHRPIFEGRTHYQIMKIIPDIKQQWAEQGIDWKPKEGGESLRELQSRAIRIFTRVCKENAGKRILVVTHGSVIKSIVHFLHGGKPEDFLHRRGVENAEVVCAVHNGKRAVVKKCFK